MARVLPRVSLLEAGDAADVLIFMPDRPRGMAVQDRVTMASNVDLWSSRPEGRPSIRGWHAPAGREKLRPIVLER